MQSVNVQQPSFLVVDPEAAKLFAIYGDLFVFVCVCVYVAYAWNMCCGSGLNAICK